MQTPSSSPDGIGPYLIELAKFLGSGGLFGFLTWLTMRKKVKPEIRQMDAVSAKTYAEARHIDGETLGDAYDRIEELYVIADSQRTQIGRLQLQCDKQTMEMELQDIQVKWMKAVIDAAGVKLSDYDYLRQKGSLTDHPKEPLG